MSGTVPEAHVELLLGRLVRDMNGRRVGRLEEFKAEIDEGECVVTEFHIGPAALLERLGRMASRLPFLRLVPRREWQYHVRWQDVDLSDAGRPVLRVALGNLQRIIVRRRGAD